LVRWCSWLSRSPHILCSPRKVASSSLA